MNKKIKFGCLLAAAAILGACEVAGSSSQAGSTPAASSEESSSVVDSSSITTSSEQGVQPVIESTDATNADRKISFYADGTYKWASQYGNEEGTYNYDYANDRLIISNKRGTSASFVEGENVCINFVPALSSQLSSKFTADKTAWAAAFRKELFTVTATANLVSGTDNADDVRKLTFYSDKTYVFINEKNGITDGPYVYDFDLATHGLLCHCVDAAKDTKRGNQVSTLNEAGDIVFDFYPSISGQLGGSYVIPKDTWRAGFLTKLFTFNATDELHPDNPNNYSLTLFNDNSYDWSVEGNIVSPEVGLTYTWDNTQNQLSIKSLKEKYGTFVSTLTAPTSEDGTKAYTDTLTIEYNPSISSQLKGKFSVTRDIYKIAFNNDLTRVEAYDKVSA